MIDLKILDEKLNQLSDRTRLYDRGGFTWEIKVLFSSLFSDANTYRYANGIWDDKYQKIDGDNEFIYDLVVFEEEKNNGDIVDIDFILHSLLVLETELNNDLASIIEDFQKLLLSNADEKVMVFKCYQGDFELWKDYMLRSILKYRSFNGRFHFVARVNENGTLLRQTIERVNGNIVIIANNY